MRTKNVVVCAAVLATLAGSASAEITRTSKRQYGPDVVGGYPSTHVLVQFAKGQVPVGDMPTVGNAQADAIMAQFGATSITPVVAFPFGNPDLASEIGLDRWYQVNTPKGTNVRALALQLRQFKDKFDLVELDGIGEIAGIPNDPEFAKCWGQHNTGQNSPCGGTGTADADVNAPAAWDIWTGQSDITLAVIDSGVTNHVDFAGKMVAGWDTVNNQGTELSDASCPHGTHCAGTAAANGNNGIGVAGMSWGAKIMPVRVLTGCSGNETDCGEGIIWAADHGAHVGTMSLRYFSGPAFFEQATQYAHAEGMVLIAANGNDFPGPIGWPAKFPLVMAVAATTNTDNKASFSSIGPESDVAAPGLDVWSSLNANGYACFSGTSMATPHTAGLACLLWSYNQGLSNDQVIQAIKDNVKDLGAPGWDTSFGWGRIDAFKTLSNSTPGLNLFVSSAVPSLVPPNAIVAVDVTINPGPDTLVPGSAKIFYRLNGGSFTSAPLTFISGQTWTANLPEVDCGDAPEFYVQAEGVSTGVKVNPFGAPANVYDFEVGTIQTTPILYEGFNAGLPAGWTATGLWHITSNCNNGKSCDGGTYAYFGDDASCTYLEGVTSSGALTSPSFNLAGGGTLKFCYRYDGEGGNPYDAATVRVNGSEVWKASQALDWTKVEIPLPVGPANSTVEFFFDTVDSIINESLGFQIDGVDIVASKVVCDDACYPDCDASGTLDIDDFICFQTLFALSDPYADCDGDSQLTIDDFICFQTFFALGC